MTIFPFWIFLKFWRIFPHFGSMNFDDFFFLFWIHKWFFFSFLGVHCWIDAWSGKSLAQGLFYLLFVQQKSGFVQPVRKRRRDLLQSLLWQEFWTQRLWIWYWCRLSSNDLKRSPNLLTKHESSFNLYPPECICDATPPNPIFNSECKIKNPQHYKIKE